jgi:hypothetical protein
MGKGWGKDHTSLTGFQKLQQVRALHEKTNPQVQAILKSAAVDGGQCSESCYCSTVNRIGRIMIVLASPIDTL